MYWWASRRRLLTKIGDCFTLTDELGISLVNRQARGINPMLCLLCHNIYVMPLIRPKLQTLLKLGLPNKMSIGIFVKAYRNEGPAKDYKQFSRNPFIFLFNQFTHSFHLVKQLSRPFYLVRQFTHSFWLILESETLSLRTTTLFFLYHYCSLTERNNVSFHRPGALKLEAQKSGFRVNKKNIFLSKLIQVLFKAIFWQYLA